MLFLLLQLDGDRYALDAAQIAEVLPLVTVRPVPHAPEGLAGFIDYGGSAVPVIDLSQLLVARPAQRRMTTRLAIVHYEARGQRHLLGLIAERATETMRRDAADFQDAGVSSTSGSQLGPVALDAAGPVRRIDVAKLLPPALADSLFQRAVRS